MTWLIRVAALSLAMPPLAAQAACLPDTRVAAIIAPAGSAVLLDEELERRGARIGRIEIRVEEVFEGTEPLAAPYRLANNLHIATQDTTVLQQLLFRSGETYQRRVLDETERLLRDQQYFNDATITPVRYNHDNTVDVSVRVHDVWTLNPGLSFGRKGGENHSRLKIEDMNFLGLGKQMQLAHSRDVDRTAWRLMYIDPNLFGSWWKLSTVFSSMSDGSEEAIALARPFYSLDTRWSAGLSAGDITSGVTRYSLGHPLERFEMQRQSFGLEGGISDGLRDGWVMRWLGGIRYDSYRFSAVPDEPAATIPADRVLAYPWAGLELIEDEYVSTRNLDQIGRTEDLYLGRSMRIEAGLASAAFGSTHDALILHGTLQAGADLGNARYLIHALDFGGRIEGGDLANAVISLNSRYYQRQSQRRVFFAGLNASLTSNLDPEEQLLLGGDNGLRGYPLRYQAGTASTLVTLEERFYTKRQLWKLFNVGAALFFDAGRTWGHDDFAAGSAGWLADVGVGLRLGSIRSGLGNVLHFDLAFPLNGGNDIDSVQFIIETRQSF